MYPTLFSTSGMKNFAEAVDAERQRQLAKFGDQRHPDGTGSREDQTTADRARQWCQDAFASGYGTWADILREEVAEAYAERDPARLRAELVQVAAVCAAWISDLDRRPTAEPCPAGLLPLGDEPVERCTGAAGHVGAHRTARGAEWSDHTARAAQ